MASEQGMGQKMLCKVSPAKYWSCQVRQCLAFLTFSVACTVNATVLVMIIWWLIMFLESREPDCHTIAVGWGVDPAVRQGYPLALGKVRNVLLGYIIVSAEILWLIIKLVSWHTRSFQGRWIIFLSKIPIKTDCIHVVHGKVKGRQY